jgi:hemerythrin-like domain-containing protein
VTHPSLTIMLREHRALSALLRSITLMLDEHRRHDTVPDFAALRAMLFYVDEFPEKHHHPKESRLLFPKLRGRDVHTDAILDRLDGEHGHGERAVRELQHALTGFEMMCDGDQRELHRNAFERSMAMYADFYIGHMHAEEAHVFPLAEAVLVDADWAELDTAFMTNRDPLAGAVASTAYRALFAKLLRTLPAAGGIGGALEALAGVGPPKFVCPRD